MRLDHGGAGRRQFLRVEPGFRDGATKPLAQSRIRFERGRQQGAGESLLGLIGLLPGERLRQMLLWVLVVSSLLTVVLALINGGYFDQTRDSIWLSMAFSLALATFMVSLALVPRQYQSFLASSPVRRIGDISYGIYLSHLLIMIYLGRYVLDLPRDGTFGDLLLWVLVVVPSAVLYGYLSARFLEQPVRRWARRFGNRNEA